MYPAASQAAGPAFRRWGLYVSRRDTELTDGSGGSLTQRGKQLERAEPYLLSHDRLVSLDGRHTLTQVDQTARPGGCRQALRHYFEPRRRGPGLLELVLQTELAGGLGQQVGEPLHAAETLG